MADCRPLDRVIKALNHEKSDRVPLFYRDVPEVEQRLIKDLGLKDREELLKYLEIDFRWVEPDYIGPDLNDEERGIRRDIWGVEYRYVKFSDEAGYWETIDHPLKDCENKQELEDYNWPQLDWFNFSVLVEQCHKYKDYAVMTAPGIASPSLLQSPIQKLLGDEKSLIDMVLNRNFFDALVEKVLEFQIPFIEKMMSGAEGNIHFFRVGDDYGTQKDLLISPDLWSDRLRPGLQAMANVIKRYGAYYYLHSCGSVKKLIPHFIELGVDVLDPVQVKASGMVPSELKKEFGDKICFSGGVDEQELLPTQNPIKIREEVFKLLDDMAYDGGFFIGPTHNFQDDIPTENILAMYEAAKEWK